MRKQLMDSRKQACLALLLVVLLGSAWTPTSSTPALVAPFAEPENCTNCSTCLAGHEAHLEEGGQYGGLHSWCMKLVGCNGHPGCGASLASSDGNVADERYQQLLNEYLDGGRDALTALVDEFPQRVRLNLARSAVQFAGCNDEAITASVPISRAEAATLAARTQPFVDLALR